MTFREDIAHVAKGVLHLQCTSIWTITDQGGSWGWRKILRLRMFLRTMVDYRIGDGEILLVADP
ncbi:UNVERIFIED_CONTAM: hypothetical protein Sindi_0087600, partial [Sesamum indicum]